MDPAGPADADARHMRRAIDLAEAGWGRVHPNPLVGAVVVRDGRVVGEGAHREFGGPHAEVEALAAAGERASKATLYVTLEPCAHQGKTPACAPAIAAAGIQRVVYAVADPDPVAAGGAARLQEQGIEVREGVERGAARRQNALFLVPLERHRPFVALKFGLSLDARIARAPGERTAVTGPEARSEVHRLRSGFDAILVGGRTAATDEPLLTVRDAPPPRVPPVRVVADPGARLSPDSPLVRTLAEGAVVVAARSDAPQRRTGRLRDAGVEVLDVPAGEGGLDPVALLDRLWDRGVRTIFCEGGGRLGAALIAADRVDRLYLFYAPRLFGAEAVPAFPGNVAFDGERTEMRRVGGDTLVTIDRSG